jgi:hypothetical protein
MSVSFESCVSSDRGLCDGPIIHPEESYRESGVSERDCGTSAKRRPWPTRAVEPGNKNEMLTK